MAETSVSVSPMKGTSNEASSFDIETEDSAASSATTAQREEDDFQVKPKTSFSSTVSSNTNTQPSQQQAATQQKSGDLVTANRLLRSCRTLIDQLNKQVAAEKEENARLREEFNKYKVRVELARKNSEMEINSLSEVNMKFKQYNVVSHDYQSELEALKRRYEALDKDRTDARNDAAKLREQLVLERTERARVQDEADLWKRRAEFIGPEAMAKAKEESSDELNEVRREYRLFREHTLKAMEEKEAEIVRARTSSESATELAYLRDVIIKYLASVNDPASRASMEAAIASVLRFNQQEVDFVKQKRRSDAGWKVAMSSVLGL